MSILGHAIVAGTAGTVLVQILIQGIGFASSILIIRWTTQEQYALFTLGISLLGALTALADSGVAANVMAQGGRVWQDRAALGGVLAAGNRIRSKLGMVVCVVVVPVAAYLTVSKFGSGFSPIASVCAVLVAFACYLPGTLLEVPLKLHQDLRTLLRFRLLSNVARVAATVIVAFFAPFAWAVIAAGAFTQGISNFILRRIVSRHADLSQPPSATGLNELKKIVTRSLPGAIYFSVQAQASLWLLAILGLPQAVAEMGALGRIAAIAALATIAFDTVVVPRVAKLQVDVVRDRSFKILVLCSVLLAIAAASCASMAPAFLSLLGSQYSDLQYEFSVLCLATALGLLSSFVWALNAARAYVPPWYVYPLSGTASYVGFCLLFGVSTLAAALHVQLASAVGSLFTNLLVFEVKSRLEKRKA